MSYGPFLGGRRICIGKTFAESIGKTVLSIIFGQLEFEFVDQKLKIDKTPNSFLHSEVPVYEMYVSL